MTLDRERHGVRNEGNRIQVLLGRAARLAIVDGEGAENPSVRRLDGRGPAGPQPVCHCKISVVDPKRILGNVRDDYGLATEGGRTAGSNGRADCSAVNGVVVGLRQARGGPVQKMLSLFVEHQDRDHHLDIGPPFYGVHQLIQDIGKGNTGRNLGEHAPFHLDLLEQSLLRMLVLGDVAGDAEQSHGRPLGIARNRALERDPAHLAGMRAAGRMHHPVFGLPGAAGALCLREGGIDALQVVWMDEAPPFLDRRGRHAVPMDAGDARIALEVPGGDIHAERTELGSTEGQLKALIAVLQPVVAGLECRFAPASLVEQRRPEPERTMS